MLPPPPAGANSRRRAAAMAQTPQPEPEVPPSDYLLVLLWRNFVRLLLRTAKLKPLWANLGHYLNLQKAGKLRQLRRVPLLVNGRRRLRYLRGR